MCTKWKRLFFFTGRGRGRGVPGMTRGGAPRGGGSWQGGWILDIYFIIRYIADQF